jgi:hypothetical protein
LSLPLSLVRVVLADRLQPQLERPSLWILATDILVGIGLMLVDGICPARNHHLQLFRLSSERSRERIEKVGIKSEPVDRFMGALWFDAELESSFRKARFHSVELIVQALDNLSFTVSPLWFWRQKGVRGKQGSDRERDLHFRYSLPGAGLSASICTGGAMYAFCPIGIQKRDFDGGFEEID